MRLRFKNNEGNSFFPVEVHINEESVLLFTEQDSFNIYKIIFLEATFVNMKICNNCCEVNKYEFFDKLTFISDDN